jgi:hypothetical protein
LGKKKGKTPSKQPEQVFEDFAKKIAEIITNKEPIAAKIIREQSNKTLNKTNYLMGFQGDKKTVSKQNQSTIVKPSFPAFQKGFVSHGAIDYDFAIMESKLEQENVHHENHGHDGHSGDSDIKKRVASAPAPSGIPVASTNSIVIVGSGSVPSGTYNKKAQNSYIGNVGGDVFHAGTGTIYNLYPDISPNYNIYFLLGPNATITTDFGDFITNDSSWKIYNIFNDDGAVYSTNGTNVSTDANYIPTSGWSPSITITAA